MGSIDTYRQAHVDILQGKVRVPAAGILKRTDKASVLIGDGAVIEDGVEVVGNVVIGPGCHIGCGVLLDECILWDQVQISEKARLQGCILGTGCQVSSNSQLGEGIVIGAGCQVAPGQCLGQADKIIR